MFSAHVAGFYLFVGDLARLGEGMQLNPAPKLKKQGRFLYYRKRPCFS